jgi:hypothetical protein
MTREAAANRITFWEQRVLQPTTVRERPLKKITPELTPCEAQQATASTRLEPRTAPHSLTAPNRPLRVLPQAHFSKMIFARITDFYAFDLDPRLNGLCEVIACLKLFISSMRKNVIPK